MKNYRLKKCFLKTMILVFVCVGGIANYSNAEEKCVIVPLPQNSFKELNQFELSSNTVIQYEAMLHNEAHYLQKELLKHKGVSLRLAESSNLKNYDSCIKLRLSSNAKKDSKKGFYEIKMNNREIFITSDSPNGVFYGIVSIIQMAKLYDEKRGKISIDCWSIQDYPLYEWRGFMLDESRHFFGKTKVKQLLDWMAFYKLNKFHWHLTDSPGWRIEIKKYPLLAYVGGVGNWSDKFLSYWNPNAPSRYYTQEDIKEIVSYAAERYIDVIPEIDMPGHASAAVRAYPEFSGGGTQPRFPNYTFNPGKDTVYTFLTDVLKEIDVLFPSQIIHLGGDEVHFGNKSWETDSAIQNLMKRENLKELKDVENYFFKRMSDSLFRLNNRIAAWDEVADADLPPEKTIVYFWRQNRIEQLKKSLEKGYSIILSPRLPMYLDYAQDSLQVYGVPWKRFGVNSYDKIYNFSKNNFDVTYPKDSKILGIQANLWTERVISEDRLDYMLFPRIAALAETAWTEEENKNIDNFNERLKKQLNFYKEDNIYYYNPFEPRLTGEPTK